MVELIDWSIYNSSICKNRYIEMEWLIKFKLTIQKYTSSYHNQNVYRIWSDQYSISDASWAKYLPFSLTTKATHLQELCQKVWYEIESPQRYNKIF